MRPTARTVAAAIALVVLVAGCRDQPRATAVPRGPSAVDRRSSGPNSNGARARLPVEPGVAPVPIASIAPTAAETVPQPAAPSTTSRSRPASTAPSTPPCVDEALDGSGFAADSWELPATLMDQLRALIDRRFVRVDLIGHTDPRPTTIGNTELSLRRAHAVGNALVQLGVARSIISEAGVGATQPAAATDDEPDYAADRRVEIRAWCAPR